MLQRFYKSFTWFYTSKQAWVGYVGTFGPLFHQIQHLMRIFAFLIGCLSLAAFGAQKTSRVPSLPDCSAQPTAQAANILFQSADGGKTWQDYSRGLPEKLQINSVFAQNGEVYLGVNNGTIYHSRNPEKGIWDLEVVGGAFQSFGSTEENENMVTNIFSGRAGLYACVYKGGFFRKKAGSSTWQPMHLALGENIIQAVVEKPDGTIFVGCPGGIYKSEDDGKSWKHVFEEGWVNSLVAANGVLIGSGSKGLLRSTDGGEHWNCVLPDEGSVYNTSIIEGRLPVVRDRFAALRVASPRHSEMEPAQLLRTSTDGGKTWERMAEMISPMKEMNNLTQVGEYLFCSHRDGISRSSDWGETWELVRPAIDPDELWRFKLAGSGKSVFAVVVWGGC
jgi:photosystem II stability/assembly factor-like uncharacterized protein